MKYRMRIQADVLLVAEGESLDAALQQAAQIVVQSGCLSATEIQELEGDGPFVLGARGEGYAVGATK